MRAPNFTATLRRGGSWPPIRPTATAAFKKRTFPLSLAVCASTPPPAPPRALLTAVLLKALKAAKCALDRKCSPTLAATDAAAFGELVTIAKNALKAKPAATLAKV